MEGVTNMNNVYDKLYIFKNGAYNTNSILKNSHQSWISHSKNRFSRELAYYERSLGHLVRLKTEIKNNKMLVALIGAHVPWTACFASVYAFESWAGRPDNAIIDRIFFDLDCETDPQIAIDDAITLIGGMRQYNIKTTAYFSGKKGIAVYVDFAPVPIAPENKKATVAAFQGATIKRFGLKTDKVGGTIDSHVIGDINRVSRLPNTKHQSSGLFCIPVALNELKEGIEHVRDLARRPRFDVPVEIHDNSVMPDYLLRLEKQILKDREQRRLLNGLTKLEHRYEPWRCDGNSKDERITNTLIDTMKRTGTLRHDQKVGLVWGLDDLGWTKNKIVSLLVTHLIGATQKKTKEQVDSVLRSKRGKHRGHPQ
ncbi:MAG: hypothetical protein KAR25_03145 [Methanosarcinales archaeon]|nr:hypothetical protein [Methanosarcinales archaeon]